MFHLQVLSQRLSPHPGDAATLNPPRLSPNSLERRLTAELKYQDGIDVSLRQLSNVDRTRALSMAQQETVSLAQVLKVGRLKCCMDCVLHLVLT